MGDEVVLLDRPAEAVARLLVNRPTKRNAIDYAVRQSMLDKASELLADKSIRALIIGGVEGVFSAGGDLPSMKNLSEQQARERLVHIHELCRVLAYAKIPVVSAFEGVIAGAAVGLGMLGDSIVMGRKARIIVPFLNLGLTPDWGQRITVPRRVGVRAAKRLFFGGNAVTADDALNMGLVDELCDDADVMAKTVRLAVQLAQLPREAFWRTKYRLNDWPNALEAELEQEQADQVVCLTSPDFEEGYRSFFEKRAPRFA